MRKSSAILSAIALGLAMFVLSKHRPRRYHLHQSRLPGYAPGYLGYAPYPSYGYRGYPADGYSYPSYGYGYGYGYNRPYYGTIGAIADA